MPHNKAIAFLFNNCEKLLLRTSHSHAQLRKRLIKSTKDNRSNRQVCHIYSVDVSSLSLSVNRVEVYLSVFALFSYCNLVLCRQKLRKLHRFNAAVDGLFAGRGDNVCLGLCKCAAAMHAVE